MQIPVNPLQANLTTGVTRANGGGPPVSFGGPPHQPPQEVFTPTAAAPAPTEQRVQTRSGLSASWRQDQHGVAIQATLPAGGGLLPVAVQLAGDARGWTAHVGPDFKEAKPAQVGSDGRVYVELEKGAPSVVFDPQNLDFGLAADAAPTPTGWQRSRMEVVDQQGIRHYRFNEEAKAVAPGVTRTEFTEVTWNHDQRQLAAQRVVRTTGEQPVAADDYAGKMLQTVKNTVSGANAEIPLGVQGNQNGSFAVSPPNLGQLANKNAVRLLFGDVLTPFMQKQKAAAFAGTFMPFSAVPMGSLFPVLVGGQAPVDKPPMAVPPAMPQVAAPAPGAGGFMEQIGMGGNGSGKGIMEQLGLDGLFGGKKPQQAPVPHGPVGPPVTFGQPAPTQGGGAPVQFGPPPTQAPNVAPTQPGPPPARAQGGAPVQFGQPPAQVQGGAPVQFGQPPAQAQGGAPVQLGQPPAQVQSGAPVQFGPPPTGVSGTPSSGGPPVSFDLTSGGNGFGFAPVGHQPQDAQDPLAALRQKFSGVEEARVQAAWTLSGGNPAKAEQLLQQMAQ